MCGESEDHAPNEALFRGLEDFMSGLEDEPEPVTEIQLELDI